jgi:putative PEP-CTERM system histidine kinase
MSKQIAAGLLNLRLADEIAVSRQMEAFQTMSTFLVHDLKNAANSLSLMLQNLPLHFDNPAFRADALSGMSATALRVNQLIARLGLFREKLELHASAADLNELVTTAVAALSRNMTVEVAAELAPLPRIAADHEQIRSVVTNLLLNAQEASPHGGRITVQTARQGALAVLSVIDHGCGMSPDFVRRALFRPFQTTKKKGLGIGMFQARIIVTAHRGTIQVETQPGGGTTFRVSLPLWSAAS